MDLFWIGFLVGFAGGMVFTLLIFAILTKFDEYSERIEELENKIKESKKK